jgi:hypothetical protein
VEYARYIAARAASYPGQFGTQIIDRAYHVDDIAIAPQGHGRGCGFALARQIEFVGIGGEAGRHLSLHSIRRGNVEHEICFWIVIGPRPFFIIGVCWLGRLFLSERSAQDLAGGFLRIRRMIE